MNFSPKVISVSLMGNRPMNLRSPNQFGSFESAASQLSSLTPCLSQASIAVWELTACLQGILK